ncbi:MAG: TRAM domain-containing protein, partial [Planctomycetes bacterium]|nr:TRAM domain-containing protein [Planctomycetota bacterium]
VLLADQEEISRRAQEAFVGRDVEVLVEGTSRRDPGRLTGRTVGNRIVVFPGDPSLAGSLVLVKIESSTPLTLAGRRAP